MQHTQAGGVRRSRRPAHRAAYETLIDDDKRRAYDSSTDFDDSVPDDDEGITDGALRCAALAASASPPHARAPPDTFFAVYDPVFVRNSRQVLAPALEAWLTICVVVRWSTAKSIPQLGDMNTPFEDVDK